MMEARPSNSAPNVYMYGGAGGCCEDHFKEHLTVAHFVVVAPSLDKTCSSLHCACRVVLRFLSLCSVPIL